MGTITAMAEALPHLLVEVPKGELSPETISEVTAQLQLQLNDDSIAIKLGRAFMLGRLHNFAGVRDAFDPFGKPAMDTIDECNLYAGGYQYDLADGQNGNEKAELLRKFLKADKDEAEARIARAGEIVVELDVLHAREVNEGLSLELVAERCELKLEMTTLTMANLMTVFKTMEIRLLMDSYEEAPVALDGIEKIVQSYFEAKNG